MSENTAACHPDVCEPARLDPSRLSAPPGQGDVLVEPPASELRGIVEYNRALLSQCDATLLGTPLQKLRAELRSRVCGSGDAPIIATGHQPDFVHAGVWAKHVVAMRLAAAMSGEAVNLIVDHDAPRTTRIDVPSRQNGTIRLISVPYADWPSGAAFEGMPVLSSAQVARMRDSIRAAMGGGYDESLLPLYFDELQARTDAADWVDQAVGARRQVEQSLGVSLTDVRASRIWCGPLLGQMIVDARRFAECYNAALAAHRREHRVRSAQQPIPDLDCLEDGCEVAAWIYRPGELRRRLFVRETADGIELLADDQRVSTLSRSDTYDWRHMESALGAIQPWRIRPRALTLTLWARLMLADLFIHGIGGAHYDLVTDGIMRRYLDINPPRFACVSATLRLPLAATTTAGRSIRELRQQVRHMRYNPQRFIHDASAGNLVSRRAELIRRSDQLRQRQPGHRAARRDAFNQIRSINQSLREKLPQWDATCRALESAIEHRPQRLIARRRDYFFAMHRRDDLACLMEKLPGVEEF